MSKGVLNSPSPLHGRLSRWSVFLLIALCATAWAEGQRDSNRASLNKGWWYLEVDAPGPESLDLKSQAWRPVTLPHTWNSVDAVDAAPGYRRGAGWYRRTLFLPEARKGERVILMFEAVNMKADVFVNGRHAGAHVGGYLGFTIDVTPHCTFGQVNHILVRADNGIDHDLIPSQKSDFILHGGITRDVWLEYAPVVALERALIRTPRVDSASAETHVEYHVHNASARPRRLDLTATIRDTAGRVVSASERRVDLPAGQSRGSIIVPPIPTPALWSPDSPALYTLEVSLGEGGKMLHSIRERFGYRFFEFRERGPFLLNGRRLLLRGTQRHEDHAGLGGAVPDSITREEFRQIKGMGANFIRLAHYPQDPEVYRMCDELGLLVWDELPWCRGGVGGTTWKENTRRMFREMILQNFNHPSIILWSIGNEVESDPDRQEGGNVDSIRAFLRELNVAAHTLDPGRFTAMRRFPEGADIPDVFSPSIWMGWYHQVYANYERVLEENRARYRRLVHAEYGGDSHAGRHVENPVDGAGYTTSDGWDSSFVPMRAGKISDTGDWSESYIVDLFDWHLTVSERLAWFAGSAQWIFKDFATPLRPENPIPYVNQKGLTDRAGNPKDAYFVFKSRWTTSPRFCYIQSRTWTARAGPKGLSRAVRVYSNCDTVTLFVNGRSLGARVRNPEVFPAAGLLWDVMFAEGVNRIVALGPDGAGGTAGDTLDLTYTHERHGVPASILLFNEALPGGNVLVTAKVVDAAGQTCLSARDRIYFSSTGPGSLLADRGTPTGSRIIELSSGVARIVFAPSPDGSSIVEVRTHALKGAYLMLPAGTGSAAR